MIDKKLVCAALLACCGLSCGSDSRLEQSERGVAGGEAGSAGAVLTIGVAGSLAISIPTLPTLMCDASAVSESRCGDQMCPDVPSYLKDACYVNCCSADGRCATRNTAAQFAGVLGQCTAPALADARCPSAMFSGVAFGGCCDASNQCGVIAGTLCTSATNAAFNLPMRSCDALPAATQDAGL